MEQDHTTPHAPDFSGEEMKLPETARTTTVTPDTKSPLSGLLVALLIILLLFILGGLYLWFTTLTAPAIPAIEPPQIVRPTAEENNEPESTTAEAAVETQSAMSTSDELTAIEADLLATDVDNLDADLSSIESEFDANTAE